MIELMVFSNAWVGALVIFGLRVLNMTLDTLRMLFVMRGKKTLSWVVGFFVLLWQSNLGETAVGNKLQIFFKHVCIKAEYTARHGVMRVANFEFN